MRLVIVDFMPLLYRGHFAMLRKPRMTTWGFNSSALHFFVSSLFDFATKRGATHVALVSDCGPTFRHELYPQYKAQRDKMPEEIAASMAPAREFAAAMGVPVVEVPGFEADDVAGSLAALADAAGCEAWIVSPDKDMAQLVTERVSLLRPSRSPGEREDVYDPARVRAEWGLAEPAQMIDWLGMAGDSADNIPGLPGIGPKKASELLAKFGSLEEVLAHAGEIPGKTGENIAANAAIARLSRDLATIRRDVPLPLSIEGLASRPFDEEALRSLLARYEFASLSSRIFGRAQAGATPAAAASAPASPPVQTDLFGGGASALAAAAPPEPQPLSSLAAALAAASRFAVLGTEEGVFVATSPDREWFIPANGGPEAALPPSAQSEAPPPPPPPPPADDLFAYFSEPQPEPAAPPPAPAPATDAPGAQAGRPEAVSALADALADASKTKVGHDLKPTLRALRRMGMEAAGPFEDVMLAQYVLNPTLAGRFHPKSAAEIFAAAQDAAPRVEKAGAARAWREAENPLVPVLLDMEDTGVLIDTAALSRLSSSLGAELTQIGARIFELAGEPFNIDSPKQLGAVLFERLGLQGGAKTSRGFYSTAEEVLQGLAKAHPIVPQILEWRAVSKLKSTYVDKLPQCVSPADGRVHTTFLQALTETGRLSSENPNLQNIPIRTERGKPIRAAFVAAPGCALVSADYSQIELRVMASLSRDESLVEAFRRGEDIHAATAARVFGIDEKDVTREQRARCKQVSFGIIYGISAFGLSQRLGMSRHDADALIKAWFELHGGVKAWIDSTIAHARADGFVTTALGRRRALPDIVSRNAAQRAASERIAVNTPVQGTAADIAKLAMVRVAEALEKRGLAAKLVLQIHDELLVEAPEGEVPEVSAIVKEAMEGAFPLEVPLVAEVGTGRNWLQAH